MGLAPVKGQVQCELTQGILTFCSNRLDDVTEIRQERKVGWSKDGKT
jgi:hypothetical protein